MNTDLFYSYTNYKLTENIIFPAIDIIGFNILVNTDSILPLHLQTIRLLRKINNTSYIFTLADKDNNVCANFTIDSNIQLNRDYYNIEVTDTEGANAGVITLHRQFLEWLYTMSFNSIHCTENTLLLNPTYCSIQHNTDDCRIIYNGTRIDNIRMNNIICTQDKNNPHLYVFKNIYNDTMDEQVDYAHTIKFVDGSNTLTLTGKNINFIPVNSDSGIIKFDGQSLRITDIGKE